MYWGEDQRWEKTGSGGNDNIIIGWWLEEKEDSSIVAVGDDALQ
jgi:hypothetical protein